MAYTQSLKLRSDLFWTTWTCIEPPSTAHRSRQTEGKNDLIVKNGRNLLSVRVRSKHTSLNILSPAFGPIISVIGLSLLLCTSCRSHTHKVFACAFKLMPCSLSPSDRIFGGGTLVSGSYLYQRWTHQLPQDAVDVYAQPPHFRGFGKGAVADGTIVNWLPQCWCAPSIHIMGVCRRTKYYQNDQTSISRTNSVRKRGWSEWDGCLTCWYIDGR